MNQIMKETAPEVKREIFPKSKRKDKFAIPAWLIGKSNESCYEFLSKVGRIEHFPASFLTHPEEMMRFFGLEHYAWNSFWFAFKGMVSRYNFYAYYPKVEFHSFSAQIKKQAEAMGVSCNESIDAEGNHFFSRDKNPQHVVKLGNPARCHSGVRLVSMKGIIIMAFYLEKNPTYATKMTRKIVKYCDELGFATTKVPTENLFSPEDQLTIEPEHTPQDSVPEPTKLDPAQTLTQMFNAMLTLLMKESEERGAEKIIQQLKEAGKL